MATRTQRSRSKRPSEKATYHQITGAGRSRIKRQFFGIAESDAALITKEVGAAIDGNLSRDSLRRT